MCKAWFLAPLLFMVGADGLTVEASSGAAIQLSQSIVPVNGPWMFRTGDDARWADPDFDDSSWEIIDLTPAPSASTSSRVAPAQEGHGSSA